MKTPNKRTGLLFALMLLHLASWAQDQPEMATGLRQSGKIYVVVAVLAVIMIGLAIFLIMLDRRIGKLEKKSEKE